MKNLREYQETGADFLYEHDRAIILGTVGSGKTATTLIAMQDMLDDGVVNRWLVVAPKKVAENVWRQEAAVWTPRLRVEVAVGTPVQRNAALMSNAHVVVVNFDVLQSIEDLSRFDALCIDELSRFKTPGNPRSLKRTAQKKGKRYEHFWRLAAHIPVRWGLTGSFTSNGLEDVFGQCRMIDETYLGVAKSRFMKKYFFRFDNRGVWTPKRGSMETIMSTIRPMVHLLDSGQKSSYETHFVVRSIELGDREPYEKMKRDFAVYVNDEKILAKSAAALTTKLQQMAGGFVYQTTETPSNEYGKMVTQRQAHWFSPHRFDEIDDILQENQRANTIIAYCYQEELAELKRRYPHAVEVRDKDAVDRWNQGKIELLLLHPKSAGHGLNLQHGGNKIIFSSLPWSREEFEQVVGRMTGVNRQVRDVWVYILLTEKTIDARIWAALHEKKTISEIAMEELAA